MCSEKHRAFYKEQIGKTYQDSITAYYQILENKMKNKTTIDKPFEYNTYIRDFFADNEDKSLEQANKLNF